MNQSININLTVYELCKTYPEIVIILKSLGFHDIVKPGMLETAGRFMTIPKGASLKKIDLEMIKNTLLDHGFYVEGEDCV